MDVPIDLIAAYSATHFRVTGVPEPFVLWVGQRSDELAALHAAYRVGCSAFMTAWNPRSKQQPEAVNHAAQAQMVAELEAAGYRCLVGIGEDPSGQWPAEESVLVPGIGRAEAEQVGGRFGQNAIVWTGTEAVPELVMLSGGPAGGGAVRLNRWLGLEHFTNLTRGRF